MFCVVSMILLLFFSFGKHINDGCRDVGKYGGWGNGFGDRDGGFC